MLLSLILTLPFALLEAANQTITRQNAPGLLMLFGLLWSLPLAFILIGRRVARTAGPVPLVLQTLVLAVLGVVWAGLVNDQLPCFLGLPNCD